MPPSSSSTTSTNKVQISVETKDNSSESLKGIRAQFDKVSEGVGLAKAQTIALTAAFAGFGRASSQAMMRSTQGVQGLIGSLGSLFQMTKSVATYDVGGQTVWGMIAAQAEKALAKSAKLSEVLKSTRSLTSDFGAGLSGFEKKDPLAGLDKKFGQIFDKNYKKIAEAFTKMPVKDIPLLGKLLDPKQIPYFGAILDRTLSNVLFDNLIKGKMPGVLKSVLGDNVVKYLSSGIAGLFKNTPLKFFLSDQGKQLTEGSAVGAFESRFTRTLTHSFSKAFVYVDSFFSQTAVKFGKLIGTILAPTLKEYTGLESLNKFLGGSAKKGTVRAGEGVAETVTGMIDFDRIAKSISKNVAISLASGNLMEIPLSVAMGGVNPIAGFLANSPLQGPLDSLIRGADPKMLNSMGEGISNALNLSPTLEKNFEKQLAGVVTAGFNIGLDAAVKSLQPFLDKIWPEFHDLAYAFGQEITNAIGEFIGSGKISKFFKDLYKNLGINQLFDTSIGIATKEIKELEKAYKFVQEQVNETPVSEYRKRVEDVRANPELNEEQRNAELEKIRQELAEKNELKQYGEGYLKRIDELQKQIQETRGKPEAYRQKMEAAKVNPELTEEEKEFFVTEYNRLMQEAQNEIDYSPVQQFFKELNEILFGWLDEEFSDNILKNLLTVFQKVNKAFEGIIGELFAAIGESAALSFGRGMAEGFIEGLAPVIDQIDEFLLSTLEKIQDIPNQFTQPVEGVGNAAAFLSGMSEPMELFNSIQTGASQAFEAIAEVGQQLTFFQSGFETLRSVVLGGPFELLIGQNIRLKEQILSTQSSLVGTSKVIDKMTGQAITDPTKAIEAVKAPIEAALDKIRTGSLELVGVTSNQLVEVFDIIAGQASTMGLSLDDASDLTLSMAASLGTLGVPLHAARQEVVSILQASIDQNSILAKSLNITNQQVNSWKQQGKLMTELTRRLESFRSGNRMAAMSVGGLSSNIQEIVETIGRQAGEKLLDPIVKEMSLVYEYLSNNMDAISDFISEITTGIFNGLKGAFDALKVAFKPLEGLLVSVPRYLSKSLVNALNAFSEALKFVMELLDPFINTMVSLFEIVKPVGQGLLQVMLQAKLLGFAVGALGSSFGLLANLVPVVGEVMFGLNMRMLPLVNLLPNLTQATGSLGIAGFLTLGKHMNEIPGLASFVVSKMGPIGPLIGGLLPLVAGIGIQIVGLTKIFPQLNVVLQGLLAQNPAELVKKLSQMIALVPGLGFLSGGLNMASDSLRQMAGNMTVAEFATAKFKEMARLAGLQVRGFIINTAALGIGLWLLFKAFDKFVLQNKELLDTLSAIGTGLKDFLGMLWEAKGILAYPAASIAGIVVTLLGLHTAILAIMATQIAGWLNSASAALLSFSKLLGLVKLTSLAAGAKSAGIGLQMLSIFLTKGSVESAKFAATNQVNVITLSGLQASILKTTAAMEAFIVSIFKATIALMKGFVKGVVAAVQQTYHFLLTLPSLIGQLLVTAKAAWTAQGGLGGMVKSLWGAIVAAVASTKAFLTQNVSIGASGATAAGASTGFSVLSTAIWKVVSGMIAMAAPIALIVAGLAAIGLKVYEKKLEAATEQTDRFESATNKLSEGAIRLKKKILDAQAAQEDKASKGITLTKEEIAANQQLLDQSAAQKRGIEEQIKVLEEALDKTTGKENKSRIQQQIDELKASLESLQETTKDVKIAPQDLARQGSVYEQITNKVNAAMTAIKQGAGDPTVFNQKGQELIELTNQQIQLGHISTEESVKRFKLLSSNVLADKDLQLKAQQAITEAYKVEYERRQKIAEQTISEIDILVQEGELSAIEGEKRTTEERIKLSELRIEQIKKEREEKRKSFEMELQNALAEIERRRKELEGALQVAKGEKLDPKLSEAVQVGTKKLEAIDAQITQAQEKLAKAEKGSKGRGGNPAALKKAQEELEILIYRRNLIQSEITNTQQKIGQTPVANPEQVNAIQEQLAGLVKDEEAARAAIAGSQARYNEQTEQEETTHQNTIRSEQAKARKAKRENLLRDLDDESTLIENQFRNREISETEYEEKRDANRKKRIALEISQLVEDLNKLAETDYQGRSRIYGQIAKLDSEEKELDKEARDRRKALLIEDYEEELKIIQAQFAKGEISRQELNQKTRDNRLAQAEEERKQLQESLSKLKETDKEGREKIIAQLEELEIKKTDILGTYQDQEFTRITEATEKSLKVVEEVELGRLIEIQKLSNKGIILVEEAEEKKLDAALDRIKKEIEAEKAKLAELSRMPSSTNPEQEKKRIEAIANSRRALMQMSLRLLQTEDSRMQAHLAKLRRQTELANLAIENQIGRQNLALERQSRIYEAISKGLENRAKLMSAQKELLGSSSNFLLTSIDSISKLEKSDIRRQKLAEITAAIKLKALEQEIELERQSLALQQQQNELAAEREIMQARIASGQALLNLKKTEGEAKVKMLDPKLQEAEKEQLRLQIEVARDQYEYALKNVGLARESLGLTKKIGQLQKEGFENQAEARMQSARVDAIMSLPENSATRNSLSRTMREQIAGQLGQGSVAELAQNGRGAARELITGQVLNGGGGRQPGALMPVGGVNAGTGGAGVGQLALPGAGQTGGGQSGGLINSFLGGGQQQARIPRMPGDVNGTLAAFDPNLMELAPYLNEQQRARYQQQLAHEYGMKYGVTGMGMSPEPASTAPVEGFPGISAPQGQQPQPLQSQESGDLYDDLSTYDDGRGLTVKQFNALPIEEANRLVEEHDRKQIAGRNLGAIDNNELSMWDDGSGLTIGQYNSMSAQEQAGVEAKFRKKYGGEPIADGDKGLREVSKNRMQNYTQAELEEFNARSGGGAGSTTDSTGSGGFTIPSQSGAGMPSTSLPSPDSKAFTGGANLLDSAAGIFMQAVDKFVQAVDDLMSGNNGSKKGGGSTEITLNNNVTINASSQDTGQRLKNEVLKQLDRVVRTAEAM